MWFLSSSLGSLLGVCHRASFRNRNHPTQIRTTETGLSEQGWHMTDWIIQGRDGVLWGQGQTERQRLTTSACASSERDSLHWRALAMAFLGKLNKSHIYFWSMPRGSMVAQRNLSDVCRYHFCWIQGLGVMLGTTGPALLSPWLTKLNDGILGTRGWKSHFGP